MLKPMISVVVSFSLGLVALGCGTRTLYEGASRHGADASSDAPGDAAEETPSGNVPGETSVFEVSYFRLGLTTPDGADSSTAWKKYGFDLDSVCTSADDSKTSIGTCMRVAASKPSVLADGDGCVDNNFGSQLVPLIKTIAPDAEKTLVAGILKGGATLALRIDDLAPSGADPSAPGSLFAAKGQGGAAKLDGTDALDVDPASLQDGDLAKPIATLAGAVTVTAGVRTWIGKADQLALPAVFIQGVSGPIAIRGAVIAIDLDSHRGMVGGYAVVKEIQNAVAVVLGKAKLCPGSPIYASVLDTVNQSADMPALLPHDTTKTCEAISIGLGVEVTSATIAGVAAKSTPPVDPCPPK